MYYCKHLGVFVGNILILLHVISLTLVVTLLTRCRRAAATICPCRSPPSVGAEAPRAAEPTVPADRNVAAGSHGQYLPLVTAAAA